MPNEKTIHNSSLTTKQLRHKADLEKAVDLIESYKSGELDKAKEIIGLITGVIMEENSV